MAIREIFGGLCLSQKTDKLSVPFSPGEHGQEGPRARPVGQAVPGVIYPRSLLQRGCGPLGSRCWGGRGCAGGLGSLSLPLEVTLPAFQEYLWALSFLICVMGKERV